MTTSLEAVCERLEGLIVEAESIAGELERGPVEPEAGKTIVAGVRRIHKSLAATADDFDASAKLTPEAVSAVHARIRKLSVGIRRIETAVS